MNALRDHLRVTYNSTTKSKLQSEWNISGKGIFLGSQSAAFWTKYNDIYKLTINDAPELQLFFLFNDNQLTNESKFSRYDEFIWTLE